MNHSIKTFSFYILIGLLLGLVEATLYFYRIDSTYLRITLFIFALFFLIAFDGQKNFKLAMTSLIAAMMVFTPWIGVSSSKLIIKDSFGVLFLTVLAISIANAFNYAYHRTGSIKLSYGKWFFVYWNSFLLVGIAYFFWLIMSVLFFTFAFSLNYLGYEELLLIFLNNYYFRKLGDPLLLFSGLAIAKQCISITDNNRIVFFKVAQIFFPALIILSTIYYIFYIVELSHDNDFIFQTRWTVYGLNYATMALLVFFCKTIIFFNALIQDNETRLC